MKSKKTIKKVEYIRKIRSFQDALNFYHKTRANLPQILDESKRLCYELEVDEAPFAMEEEEELPTPLILDNKLTVSQFEVEQWLGTNLTYYSNTLRKLLPNVDENIEVVPKLIEGLVNEAKTGSENLAKLLKRVQKELRSSPPNSNTNHTPSPNPKELKKIEKELNERVHKLNFFKEEVDERFETFKNTLIEYISTYSLLTHILNCTKIMMDAPSINVKNIIKKITQVKEPF